MHEPGVSRGGLLRSLPPTYYFYLLLPYSTLPLPTLLPYLFLATVNLLRLARRGHRAYYML